MTTSRYPSSNRTPSHLLGLLLLLVLLVPLAASASDYYQHTFFDNSITSDTYFYSEANASAPSVVEAKDRRLPS